MARIFLWRTLFLVSLLASLPLTAQQTVTVKVDCWSGGWCTMGCSGGGKGNYSCSNGMGAWPASCAFKDPLPAGAIVTKIEAAVRINQCNKGGHSAWRATVNGQLVSGATESSYVCTCAEDGGGCVTKTHTSEVHANGFPGYVYGGNNSFALGVQAGVLCVADTDLKITYIAGKTATFTATAPVIPKASTLVNQCVQYRADITGTVKEKGKAVPKVALKFKSDRNGTKKPDTITQPKAVTDAKGSATGRIETRMQGIANISDDTADVTTPAPLPLTFGAANWESPFKMTGYIIANEADFGGATVKNPCGLTGTYRKAFLYGEGVLMQGSGKDLKGNIVTIDWAKSKRPFNERNTCFTVVSCAKTASGACAEAGTTIAADWKVVPKNSIVQIDKVGSRKAQDTGDAIKGYRIDVFRGFGKAAMKGWGNFNGTVRYMSGGGTCDK